MPSESRISSLKPVTGYVLQVDNTGDRKHGQYIKSNGGMTPDLSKACVMDAKSYRTTRKVFNEINGYRWVRVKMVTTVELLEE